MKRRTAGGHGRRAEDVRQRHAGQCCRSRPGRGRPRLQTELQAGMDREAVAPAPKASG